MALGEYTFEKGERERGREGGLAMKDAGSWGLSTQSYEGGMKGGKEEARIEGWVLWEGGRVRIYLPP